MVGLYIVRVSESWTDEKSQCKWKLEAGLMKKSQCKLKLDWWENNSNFNSTRRFHV